MQVDADGLLEAARVMEQVYYDLANAPYTHKIENNGVQAYFLEDRTLVIPGTNELLDWFDFNFEAVNIVGKETRGIAIRAGDSGKYRWHAGFLEHAHTVFTFANVLKPRRIIGHSLGAASAQIVGAFLKVPTFAFASPRPLRGATQPPGARFVINLCRSDDGICHVPPRLWDFRHVGATLWMSPAGINWGEDHRIDNYIELIQAAHVRPGLVATLPETTLA